MSVIVERAAGVGETRWAASRNGRCFALALERWSERGGRALFGERYLGRVRRVDRALGGAFVDLGVGPDGFAPFRRGRPPPAALSEGAAVIVEVRAEAFAEKGPRLALAPGRAEAGDPRRLMSCSPIAALGAPPDAPVRDADQADLDAAFDEALQRGVGLRGGGRLYVEPTQALVSLDLDLAGREGSSDRGRRAAALSLAGAEEAARQISLRGLGGLIALDLPNLDAADRASVEAAFAAAAKNCGLNADVAPINRFGVLMASVARTRRPIAAALSDAEGRLTIETLALAGLRALEREGRARRGDLLVLRLGAAAAAWLEADTIGWRAAMTDRLGARFSVEAVDAAPEFMQVFAR